MFYAKTFAKNVAKHFSRIEHGLKLDIGYMKNKTFAKKCFRAVDYPRLGRGRKNVVKCFILHINM